MGKLWKLKSSRAKWINKMFRFGFELGPLTLIGPNPLYFVRPINKSGSEIKKQKNLRITMSLGP